MFCVDGMMSLVAITTLPPSLDLSFASPVESGHLSLSNIGRDILLSDIYGLPAAFAYLAWKQSINGSLRNAWPPSYGEAAAWAIAVAVVSTASAWLPILRLRGGAFAPAGVGRTPPLHVARARACSMDLFKRRRRDPEDEDFGFGRDIDGPLTESEEGMLYAGPLGSLVFTVVTLTLFGTDGWLKWLVPDNANIYSFIVPWLVLWATWDLPSERRGPPR